MNILITGSNGFIGSNLIHNLSSHENINILNFTRDTPSNFLDELISNADRIVHLAGVNRPQDDSEFDRDNTNFTQHLCKLIELSGKKIPLIFTSSTHIESGSPYGLSKLKSEDALKQLALNLKTPLTIYRLPGIFGKWCKPNYNNVVSTFCYNITHNLELDIHDPLKSINLAYIDDLVDDLIHTLFYPAEGTHYKDISPNYSITIGELAQELRYFKEFEGSVDLPNLNTPIKKFLYSTYLSYLPISKSNFMVSSHPDSRGNFVEMIKHPTAGQISYLTAKPGTTRGGHFHNSKIEKFLVVKGSAKFRFAHVLTNEKYEIITSEANPQIVQTLPGWVHDITNIGNEEMIAIIWSNEIFDPNHPDTIKSDI